MPDVLLQADARALPLRDACVQCIVTSPPYFGLRDYGTATWTGGDNADCKHLNGPLASPRSTLQGYTGPDVKLAVGGMPFRDICGKCGAERIDKQLGLEATPARYVDALVQVFREVKRVLKPDGVCWLNLGDSYAGSGPSGASYQSETTKRRATMTKDGSFAVSKTLGVRGLSYAEKKPIPPPGLKSKDLIGIPWSVAFALRADGWYLRADIIWAKPNPMPESVTDRPTKAHEYLFLLTKRERYYYDADAIAERAVPQKRTGNSGGYQCPNDIALAATGKRHGLTGLNGPSGDTRNKRSVWTVATMPYAGAHFATMPEALVEPCILAGSRLGDLVCDPFIGSGTVGAVAERTGRRWVGADLNPAYHVLGKARTAQIGLRF